VEPPPIALLRGMTVCSSLWQNAELGQQEAARYIAKKHPKLEGLMKRRKKLAATMLRWRRDLYDARPGDFLHRFGTQLVEHEDWLKQQHPTREQWITRG